MTLRAVILGTGSALPKHRVSNDELAQRVDTSDEWIVARTGIRFRHIAGEGETTATLGADAAAKALAAAGVDAASIDLIILATATPDQTFPASATKVQAMLGINDCIAFDVAAVCSGFLYALSVADAMIRAGNVKRALVIGSETFSRILDWEDRTTCVLFGDGAGAHVQRTAEHVRKAQHVVDLIGVVRTPCGNDDVGSRGARQLRTDLGLWVGECQNHRVTRHAFNHVYGQHTRCRATQENICAVDHVSQRAGVCFLGVAGFGFIVAARATFIDHAFGIAHKNIGCRYAQAHHHVEASNRSGTGAGHSDLYFANRLVHQL